MKKRRKFPKMNKGNNFAADKPFKIKDKFCRLTLLSYTQEQFSKKELSANQNYSNLLSDSCMQWLNIDGLEDYGVIGRITDSFNIHPLTVEDILNTNQRPKYENFDKYIFITLKMIYFDRSSKQLTSEQISLILMDNIIISFQEKEGDVFDEVRQRLATAKGRIRGQKVDYLAYALIDAVVDNYFLVLERISEDTESLEEQLMDNSTPELLQSIHHLKREVIFLKKSIWPLREAIGRLEKQESPLIYKTTRIFLKDIYDHTIQIIDTVETLRDIISGMVDIYISVVSNRMNEVMKVLTMFASIFIPLTFIAGVYGMNFEYMPELSWKFGYPAVLLIMVLVACFMLGYFRRKRWF